MSELNAMEISLPVISIVSHEGINGQDLKKHIDTFCFRLNYAAYHYAAVFEVK
jgi:hypothetical protein